jgi:hypothetical protein
MVLGKAEARLVSGEPDDVFEGSLSLDDIYSEDSPPVLIGRVTDGNDRQSTVPLWDRNPDRSFSKSQPGLVATDRAPLATALANNGGKWGGRRRVLLGLLDDIAADLTASTVDLSTSLELAGVTFYTDELVGAQISFEGDSGGPYEVVSNDDTGVATIKGEFSQAVQDADGMGVIDGSWNLLLSGGQELAVVIGQDSVTATLFSVEGVRKFKADTEWESVTSYGDLGLSDDDDRPWLRVIPDGEQTRYQIEIETTYAGATVEAKLPANLCEVPTSVDGATITMQWWRQSLGATNTGDPYIVDVAPVDASQIEPHVYNITFTAATTFTVSVTFADGTVLDLGAGTVATPFVPVHPQLASFNIIAGDDAAVLSDTARIRIDPLPLDLSNREAYLYPVARSDDGDTNQRLRVAASTYNTISVRSDLLLSSYGSAVGVSATVDTVDLDAVSLGVGETVILSPDGGAAITLVSAGSGPGATAIAAELTTLDTTDMFTFTANTDGTMTIGLQGSYGSKSSLTLGSGTGHAGLGIATSGVVYGTDAVPFRVEGRWPMWGGYDGVAPAAARYIIASDLEDAIFQRWLCTNLGLVRIITPGITATSVKAAIEPFVRKNGWVYVAEFAAGLEAQALPGQAAVADMAGSEVESDYVDHLFPSRAKFLNVARTKAVTRSVAGMFLGIKSRLANEGVDGERGFHIAAANNNEQGRLSPRVLGLSDDIGRWTPPKKLLNDNGIVMLLWEGAAVYLWGNRRYSLGRTPKGKRYTITERDVFYHVARDLFVTTRPWIFKSISARRLGDIQASLREKLKVYYRDGWFSDHAGPGFEQQVTVLVPPDQNPPEELLEGNVTATIQFRPRPALENLTIVLSPTQLVSEG